MAKVYFYGQLVKNIKDNITKIISMVKGLYMIKKVMFYIEDNGDMDINLRIDHLLNRLQLIDHHIIKINHHGIKIE